MKFDGWAQSRRLPVVQDNASAGIALTCGYTAIIPLVESAAKFLGDTTSAPQIVLARVTVQAVFIAVILVIAPKLRGPWPRPLWPLIVRGVLLALGSGLVYAGLAVMPLAESSAIFFIEPLILTCLAALLLGERVGWYRLAAVVVGFAGALLIIGPNFEHIGWHAIFPGLAALCIAGASLMTRQWASLTNAFVFQLVAAGTGLVLAIAVLVVSDTLNIAAIAPHYPTITEAWLLLGVGIGSMATSLMLTQAFRITPVSIVGPFLYLEIVGATIVGYLFFSDTPELLTVLGALLVVGAGLYTWKHETRLNFGVTD